MLFLPTRKTKLEADGGIVFPLKCIQRSLTTASPVTKVDRSFSLSSLNIRRTSLMFNTWAPARFSVCKSQGKRILIIEWFPAGSTFPNPHALMSVLSTLPRCLFILCLGLSSLNKSFCLITVSTFIWCTNYFLIDSMPSYITWGVGLAAHRSSKVPVSIVMENTE